MKATRRRSEPMEALRVLVVEDEMLIGMLLADTLEAMGYDVCAVEATEIGAVAAAARWNPDLMIVDARLRNGSGVTRSEEHTSELQSPVHLVCRLLLEKKNRKKESTV